MERMDRYAINGQYVVQHSKQPGYGDRVGIWGSATHIGEYMVSGNARGSLDDRQYWLTKPIWKVEKQGETFCVPELVSWGMTYASAIEYAQALHTADTEAAQQAAYAAFIERHVDHALDHDDRVRFGVIRLSTAC